MAEKQIHRKSSGLVPGEAEAQKTNLRMVAWELTRSCNLSCRHCRASSESGPYAGELSTGECFKIIDDIASFSKPIVILTGGEPLLREDIFEIAKYGSGKGLTMVMAPNGTLLTDESVRKILDSGIRRISVSLDGPDASSHDDLRQVPGAFVRSCDGLARAKKAGLEFQINSTITKRNVKMLHRLIAMAMELGARAHHIFLLVPMGRAVDMTGDELSPSEYEDTLKFLAEAKKNSPIEIRTTCAPHFNRILIEDDPKKGSALVGRGCMAGVSFCFISNTGHAQPCGYLEVKCGDVRKNGFKDVWFGSDVFNKIRDFNNYEGKCGVCEFRMVCGGCRARAYAKYGNYLGEEPYCTYAPKAAKKY